jgi:hypothetical protein
MSQKFGCKSVDEDGDGQVVQVGSGGTSGMVFEVIKPADCYSLIYRRQFLL